MIARVFRVATIVCVVVALLWGTLIAGPMWLTRWRMSRLLADYHSIYPTQSSWADAQKLMVKWGKWGNYDGTCSANDCLYLITVSDEYNNWVDNLPEQQRERVWGSHLWTGFSIWGTDGPRSRCSSKFRMARLHERRRCYAFQLQMQGR